MFAEEYSSRCSSETWPSPKAWNSTRKVAISASLAEVVIWRAAMLSSAAQAWIISTISRLVLRSTRMPRRRIGLALEAQLGRDARDHEASLSLVPLRPSELDFIQSGGPRMSDATGAF